MALWDRITSRGHVEDRRGISHLQVATSTDGITNWHINEWQTLVPNTFYPEETWGIEDARVTYLEVYETW